MLFARSAKGAPGWARSWKPVLALALALGALAFSSTHAQDMDDTTVFAAAAFTFSVPPPPVDRVDAHGDAGPEVYVSRVRCGDGRSVAQGRP